MAREKRQRDIVSYEEGARAAESAALDDALLDAVDGIAHSLREEERAAQKADQMRRQRVNLNIGLAVALIAIAVPLVLFSSPRLFQADGEQKTATEPPPQTASPPQVVAKPPNIPPTASDAPDASVVLLPGNFTMRLPKGFEWQIRIQSLGNNQYRMLSDRNLNTHGVYALQGNRLVMLKPVDERLTEFEWQITNSDALELVEEPPTRKTGAKYLGTTLIRNPESE